VGLGRLIRDVVRLTLWAELTLRRRFDLVWRFYGALAVAASLLLGASAYLLATTANPFSGSLLLALVIAFALAAIAYATARAVSAWLVLVVAIVLPASLMANPEVLTGHQRDPITKPIAVQPAGSSAPRSSHSDEVAEWSRDHSASEMPRVGENLLVMLLLTAVCLAVFWLAQLPASLPSDDGFRHWAPRWPLLVTLAAIGAMGLPLMWLPEIYPDHTGSAESSWRLLPDQPGWTWGISLWLWLNVGYYLAEYDRRLIPYLLQRMRHPWLPTTITRREVHLVEILLNRLNTWSGRRATSRTAQHGHDLGDYKPTDIDDRSGSASIS